VVQVVCDASPARAKAVADETGAATITTDPIATITRPDVDAVIIASPDATHTPLCWPALPRANRCYAKSLCRNRHPNA
jgi:myo-inositol 2-dehydrogenase / D-chiro-inositol 1-dehydrogenase